MASEPPRIEQLTATASRTAAVARLRLSADGFVYCAAQAVGADWLVSTDEILAAGPRNASRGREAEVVLDGLEPDRPYEIFCTTRGLASSALLPFGLAAESRALVRTACCRWLTAELLSPGQDGAAFFLRLQIAPPPTSAVSLLWSLGPALGLAGSLELTAEASEWAVPLLSASAAANWSRLVLAVETNSSQLGRGQVSCLRDGLSLPCLALGNNSASSFPAVSFGLAVDFSANSSSLAAAQLVPADPSRPQVSLRCPAVLGPGDELFVEFADGGRSWAAGTLSLLAAAGPLWSRSLSAAELAASLPLPAPLPANWSAVEVRAVLCDSTGRCGQDGRVVRFSTRTPAASQLRLLGPSPVSLSPAAALRLQAADLGAADAAETAVSWRLAQGGWAVHFDGLQSFGRALSLPAFSLRPQSAVLVSALVTGDRPISAAERFVFVRHGRLRAVIPGGLQQSLAAGSLLLLDGRASLDEDRDPAVSRGPWTGLSLRWLCLEERPMLRPCPGLDPNGSSSAAQFRLPTTAEDAGRLLRVFLFLAEAASGRTASAVTRVELLAPAAAPLVRLLPGAVPAVAGRERIAVEVTAAAAGGFNGSLRCSTNATAGGLSWPLVSLSPAEQPVALAAREAAAVFFFDIAASAAAATAGPFLRLAFSLVAGQGGETGATVSLVVALNRPPSAGRLIVRPQEGRGLRDLLSLAAADWAAEELPLRFSFGLRLNASALPLLPLQAAAEQPFFLGLFPPLPAALRQPWPFVTVSDGLGAVSSLRADRPLEVLAADQADLAAVSPASFDPLAANSTENLAGRFQLSRGRDWQFLAAQAARLAGGDCAECAVDCLGRERLVGLLFNLTAAAFAEENGLLDSLSLLRPLLVDGPPTEAARDSAVELLRYGLGQLWLLSAAFLEPLAGLGPPDSGRPDVLLLLAALAGPSACGVPGADLISWRRIVYPLWRPLAALALREALPAMRGLPLAEERGLLSFGLTSQQVRPSAPLVLALPGPPALARLELAANSSPAALFQLAVLRPQLNDSRGLNLSAAPLLLAVEDRARYCSQAGAGAAACLLTVETALPDGLVALLRRNATELAADCQLGQAASFSLDCGAAGNLTAVCPADFEGRLRLSCPAALFRPSCSLAALNFSQAAAAVGLGPAVSCEAVGDWRDGRAVCRCGLAGLFLDDFLGPSPAPADRRRLQEEAVALLRQQRAVWSGAMLWAELSVSLEPFQQPQKALFLVNHSWSEEPPAVSAFPVFLLELRGWLLVNTSRPLDGSLLVAAADRFLPALRELAADGLGSAGFRLQRLLLVNASAAASSSLVLQADLRVVALADCSAAAALSHLDGLLSAAWANRSLADGLVVGLFLKPQAVSGLSPANSSAAACGAPSVAPTAAPTASTGAASGGQAQSQSAVARLAAHPDVLLALLLVAALFSLGSLLFAVLSNREHFLLAPATAPAAALASLSRDKGMGSGLGRAPEDEDDDGQWRPAPSRLRHRNISRSLSRSTQQPPLAEAFPFPNPSNPNPSPASSSAYPLPLPMPFPMPLPYQYPYGPYLPSYPQPPQPPAAPAASLLALGASPPPAAGQLARRPSVGLSVRFADAEESKTSPRPFPRLFSEEKEREPAEPEAAASEAEGGGLQLDTELIHQADPAFHSDKAVPQSTLRNRKNRRWPGTADYLVPEYAANSPIGPSESPVITPFNPPASSSSSRIAAFSPGRKSPSRQLSHLHPVLRDSLRRRPAARPFAGDETEDLQRAREEARSALLTSYFVTALRGSDSESSDDSADDR